MVGVGEVVGCLGGVVVLVGLVGRRVGGCGVGWCVGVLGV